LFSTNARPAPQRGLAAMVSFGIQAVLLGVLVLVPLLYTDALPIHQLKGFVIELPPPQGAPPPPQPAAANPPRPHQSEFVDAVLRVPTQIPEHARQLVDDRDVPPPVGPYVDGSTGAGGRNSAIGIFLASNVHVAPPPPEVKKPAGRPVVLSSGVTEGLLINRITPTYPKIAVIGRIQGQVRMQATIGRDGNIQNLQVISGPPLLVKSAIDAVKQWRYRPYLLNNEPVEVETQITVNFTLGG
jgi:protein TonB